MVKLLKTDYPKAVSRVAWWYFLTTYSISIGVLDILPDWWGYILLCLALDGIAAFQPTAKLLRPITLLLTAVVILRTVAHLLGNTKEPYIIFAVSAVIYLYIHFQICTNISDTVALLGTEQGSTIALHRDITTVTYTAGVLAEFFAPAGFVYYAAVIIHILSKTVLIFSLWGHSSRRKQVISRYKTEKTV